MASLIEIFFVRILLELSALPTLSLAAWPTIRALVSIWKPDSKVDPIVCQYGPLIGNPYIPITAPF